MHVMTPQAYDIIIVGGGVMGCAIACYLLDDEPQIKLAVIEMDSSYARASTPLSDGNTRIQFNIRENIMMSLYGLEVMAAFAQNMEVNGIRPEPGFHQQGNLFLVDEAGHDEALQGLALQKSLGCQVEWLTAPQIRHRFPLFNPDGFVGGTFGPQDGVMDPFAVMMAYRRKAQARGAEFIEARVDGLRLTGKTVAGVALHSGESLSAPVVANAAGAWAAELAASAGIRLPVEPVKRQVYVVESEVHPERRIPALFAPSGLYLIHEGHNRFNVGQSFPDDPVGFLFDWERGRFNERLWPALVDLVPAFDRLKLVGGWAGLYAVNTYDGNAILGEWPEIKGFFLANGFSGHGFQQCHAVGRYLAELILDRPPALDLSIFAPSRILENRPVFESRRKLI
jgi:FAD-dependent oxidoreductase domain-containing protein 1